MSILFCSINIPVGVNSQQLRSTQMNLRLEQERKPQVPEGCKRNETTAHGTNRRAQLAEVGKYRCNCEGRARQV